jgi:L-threonylcarbamoyladenylate synthase
MISNEISEVIDQAVGILRGGGVVIFPTDTVMGVGVDALNADAVSRLFEIKQREPNNPLPVLLPDESALDTFALKVNIVARNLASNLWPGGLTLVLNADPKLASSIQSTNGTVGFRVPNHPVTLELLRRFGGPITGTSANPSGEDAPSDSDGLDSRLVDRVDIVVPGAGSPDGLPSTVMDCTAIPPRLARNGAIPTYEILSVIQKD